MALVGFKAQNHVQQVNTRGASDEVDDRGTHPTDFDPLDARFGGFTLDVAAAPHNAKCARYFTRADDEEGETKPLTESNDSRPEDDPEGCYCPPGGDVCDGSCANLWREAIASSPAVQ